MTDTDTQPPHINVEQKAALAELVAQIGAVSQQQHLTISAPARPCFLLQHKTELSDSQLSEALINLLLDACLSTLDDYDSGKEDRENIAKKLGEYGKRYESIAARVVNPLLDALENDPKWSVRAKAAEALGQIGDLETVRRLLIATINDSTNEVQKAAQEALSSLVEAQRKRNTKTVLKPPPETLFDPLPSPLAQKLVEVIEDVNEEVEVRCHALELLGKAGDLEVVDWLVDLLKNETEDNDVRSKAALALGMLGSNKAVRPLITLLNGVQIDVNIRRCVANALGEIGDGQATKSLIRCLDDPDVSVQEAASGSLMRIDDAHVARHLIEALRKGNSEKRRKVVWLLGEKEATNAVDPLINILNSDTDFGLLGSAAIALGKIGDKKAVEPLRGFLACKQFELCVKSAIALAYLECYAGKETLLAAYEQLFMVGIVWEALDILGIDPNDPPLSVIDART